MIKNILIQTIATAMKLAGGELKDPDELHKVPISQLISEAQLAASTLQLKGAIDVYEMQARLVEQEAEKAAAAGADKHPKLLH